MRVPGIAVAVLFLFGCSDSAKQNTEVPEAKAVTSETRSASMGQSGAGMSR
jgi:hypothetical protein